ncbi:hypothetical protein [Fuerstiella marisgermanici]|nr:hypothetical protein [Fuerstiella marisgermanici]
MSYEKNEPQFMLVQKWFLKYAEDPYLRARPNDVVLVCQAVLETAAQTYLGKCSHQIAQGVASGFTDICWRRELHYRTDEELRISNKWMCAASRWVGLLFDACNEQEELGDVPSELMRNFRYAVDYHNLVMPDEEQVDLQALLNPALE